MKNPDEAGGYPAAEEVNGASKFRTLGLFATEDEAMEGVEIVRNEMPFLHGQLYQSKQGYEVIVDRDYVFE